MRSLQLYGIYLHSQVAKLRYNFVKELVVLLCALPLFGVFFYIFQDFLNSQVKSVSYEAHSKASVGLSCLILLLPTWLCARAVSSERREPDSLWQFAMWAGETRGQLRDYLVWKFMTLAIFGFGICWAIIDLWLYPFSVQQGLLIQLLLVAAAALGFLRTTGSRSKLRELTSSGLSTIGGHTPEETMYRWRLKQIYSRHPAVRWLLIFAGTSALGISVCGWQGQPYAFQVLLAFLSGFFMAMSIPAQLAEDLTYSWAERSLGVSHDQYMGAYLRISRLGGAVAGALVLGFYLLGGVSDLWSPSFWLEGGRLFLIAAIPNLITPSLMMQIDGRRPMLQAVLIFMCGLFLITAVYAHILAVGLVYLLHYYAVRHQDGRFYRA